MIFSPSGSTCWSGSVAVAGVYQSEQGDLSGRSPAHVWWEAVAGACADAGLRVQDIDGVVGEGPPGVGLRGHMPGAGIAEQLGRPLRFHARSEAGAACTLAGTSLAAHALTSGLADAVVIVTVAAGRGGGYASADRQAAVAHMAKLSGPYEYVLGTTRVSDYAIYARRHMHRYGTTPRQLAEIAVTQRYAATLHPLSVNGRRGPMTVDDVLSSPLIADPLHMLDCCLVNQGAGAMVLTRTSDVVASAGHRPVVLCGYGEGHSHIDPNAVEDITTSPAARSAADSAFQKAGVTRAEVDVAGISDHFTIGVILGLEDAGFCQPGEGGSFVQDGGTGLRGRLPTNTSGGHLSFSHAGMCAIFTAVEVVEQLRGEAGLRQVPKANLGFVTGVGGAQQAFAAAVLAGI
jgi:acetyl-CoA acetyltransferase